MTRGDREVAIVSACDDNYAQGLAVMLSSALRNLSPGYSAHVTIIDGGISPSSRERIETAVDETRCPVTLDWQSGDVERFSDLRVSGWGSHANYLRLLIPEIVPEEVGLVLYLDSDILVTGDVSALWRVGANGLSGHVAAVADYHHRTAGSVFGKDGCETIGIDPDAPYFNSGVLLIDVERWRADRISQRALDFTRHNAHLMRYSDQDALNVVLRSKWQTLNAIWNVMLPEARRYLSWVADDRRDLRRRYRGLLQRGKLFHFTGPKKPWTPQYVGAKSLTYKVHLFKSGWFATNQERLLWAARTLVESAIPVAKRQARWMIEAGRRVTRSARPTLKRA